MVALADWYILPILLQLEKLSGPTIRAPILLVGSNAAPRSLDDKFN